MSQQLISRSPDLKRLRDEGYDVVITCGYLLVNDVPYVTANKEIKRGTLISDLCLAGDVTTRPQDHVARFAGEFPHHADGRPIEQIRNDSRRQILVANVVVADHTFSSKPLNGAYENYYDKMTSYANMLSGPATVIDPSATAKTFPAIETADSETVFNYFDTASSRADIVLATNKLTQAKIAIVGLGGTGAYILDLVAKTPVREMHLFDGDTFSQHNAFRAPGAPTVEELRAKPNKAAYFRGLYSKMHRGIVAHEAYLDGGNIGELKEMAFVFLCLDQGAAKRLIVARLEEFAIPFIDVGIGVDMRDGNSLGGSIRVTMSMCDNRDQARACIPFSDGDGQNDYARNIQIADLNALNATLAVIRWKRHLGFYCDLVDEHNCVYTIDGNCIAKEGLHETVNDSSP